jgi:transposase-like protein
MPLSAETPPHCPTCRSESTERSPFTGSLVPVYVCLACGYSWRQPLAKADSAREPASVKRHG